MAAVQPTSAEMISGQLTVTGATATGTLIFDAAQSQGVSYNWLVIVTNMDADAGDDLLIGSSAALATVAAGTPLGIYDEDANVARIQVMVPPFGKLYANCTDSETRDVRVFASPLV